MMVIERVKTHEGLAALFAYRLAQLGPITFTLAANDYGFEPLSPLERADGTTNGAGRIRFARGRGRGFR